MLISKKMVLYMVCIFGMFLCTSCQSKEYATKSPNIAETFPIKAKNTDDNPQFAKSDGPYAIIHTTAGDITAVLYPELAPKAVENFIALAEQGYYDGSLFDYVVKDTLVQGGQPAKGEETSSYGTPFEDEYTEQLHHFHGALAMANKGINQNNSQFYFVASQEIPEDEKLISANMYMNELIRKSQLEINQKNKEKPLTEEEVASMEEQLNQEIQAIGVDGVPEEYMKTYQKAIEQYMKEGGSYPLDYTNTVFGQVIQGLNVVDDMSTVLVDVERKPKIDMVITRIDIVDELP